MAYPPFEHGLAAWVAFFNRHGLGLTRITDGSSPHILLELPARVRVRGGSAVTSWVYIQTDESLDPQERERIRAFVRSTGENVLLVHGAPGHDATFTLVGYSSQLNAPAQYAAQWDTPSPPRHRTSSRIRTQVATSQTFPGRSGHIAHRHPQPTKQNARPFFLAFLAFTPLLLLVGSFLFSSGGTGTTQAPDAESTGRPVTLAADNPTPTLTPTHTPTPTSTSTPTPTPFPEAIGTLAVHFLDVGQGDSILLQGADFTILIDAGRHNANDIVPYLEELGVESLDLLIGTHPHADHIGQFRQVLERFPVTDVWLSGDEANTQTYERAIDAIAASNAGYHEPRAGEVFQIGSAHIKVLHPDRVGGDFNNSSIVIRLSFGEVAFLFMGDAEAKSEQAILARGHVQRAHILKVGHHGSDTSSSLAFLEAVRPEIAIWSAGANNQYGHPHASTIERLERMGIAVLGTAIDSPIIICTDGHIYNRGDCDSLSTGTVTETEKYPPIGNDSANLRNGAGVDISDSASGCGPEQININTATYENLKAIIHIGPDRAAEMLDLRPFVSVDDMIRINGIGPARLQDIKSEGLACAD